DIEAGIQFVPTPYIYSPIQQSSPILPHNSPISNLPSMPLASTSTNILLMSSSSANKNKQSSIKLDDSFPFNFKDLPEETIPDDPQESFLVQIPVFEEGEQDPFKLAFSLISTNEQPKLKEAVDIAYCNASIDKTPFYLILDTGSLTRVISKAFADKLNRFIEKPSNLYFSDINEINDTQDYTIIARVNWLNKIQGIIDLKKGQFKFTWENKSYILSITCWEKLQYNNSRSISLKILSESNDSNNQTLVVKTNKYRNSDEKPILEINNTQVKYQNESFDNYNFHSEQASDPRTIKYYCA
ncbi:31513_t:CDS:2, partial [Racocetra persica]